MQKILRGFLVFLLALMGFTALGYYAAAGGTYLVTPAVFVVPDAYATIPGSFVDTAGSDVRELSGTFAATLFGATCKVQGSDDATTAANGNWVDIIPLTGAGVAYGAADIAVAVGTVVPWFLKDAVAAGSTGLAYRCYRLQARNTVGASVANVAAAIFGQ